MSSCNNQQIIYYNIKSTIKIYTYCGTEDTTCFWRLGGICTATEPQHMSLTGKTLKGAGGREGDERNPTVSISWPEGCEKGRISTTSLPDTSTTNQLNITLNTTCLSCRLPPCNVHLHPLLNLWVHSLYRGNTKWPPMPYKLYTFVIKPNRKIKQHGYWNMAKPPQLDLCIHINQKLH